MTLEDPRESRIDYKNLLDIQDKVLWISMKMIDYANNHRENLDGIKIGGHQASSASVVTILTSLSDDDLKDMGNQNTVIEQVKKLAKVAKEKEVGVVCSGHEAKIVRKIIGPDLLIFTPGIRMHEDTKNDQKRVCTPLESIKNGANKIIMGRSLIKGNIEENIDRVSNSIKE